MGEKTQGHKKQQPIAVSAGLEEVEITTGLRILEFKTESLLDLLILKLDSGVVGIAVGMVFSEDIQGLFIALLGDQPTRGLWNEEDEGNLDEGWEGLGEGGNSP